MSETVPLRPCGIVMKGGITSGVVYPLAITELAKEFRFKEIGGTSAGAIAAAVTAAAEYRRVTTRSTAGFDQLSALPEFLAGETKGESNLLNLFPPKKETRPLFDFAAAFLGEDAMLSKAVRATAKLLCVSWAATLVAFLPALLLLAILLTQESALAVVGLAAVELVVVAAGLLFLLVHTALHAARVTLPTNGFGLSTGMKPGDRTLPGVTEWLHATIQQTAGRTTKDAPLTFGDLWSAEASPSERAAAAERCEEDIDARSIQLQMITTALSHGRPYRLPLDTHVFSFDEEELRGYFPAEVVRHLVEKGGPPDAQGRRRLPPGREMPVVVAARMSLSFPVLFSMVPLYAVDYTYEQNKGKDVQPVQDRVWFIDGGLSSNFPVTLFDTPFPRWPTFCINLAEFHPAHPQSPDDESKNVWMVKGHGHGRADRWTRLPERGLAASGGYVLAMLDTIRNWRDNTQLKVPGFRDRIGHVKLNRSEGGLNLKMDPIKVKKLSARGGFIGAMLRERFGAKGATREDLSWNSHRWVRYQTAMALMQRLLRQMHAAFEAKDAGYPSYPELVARTRDEAPKTGQWWEHGKPPAYQELTDQFLELARKMAATKVEFGAEAPRPKPELRITPRL